MVTTTKTGQWMWKQKWKLIWSLTISLYVCLFKFCRLEQKMGEKPKKSHCFRAPTSFYEKRLGCWTGIKRVINRCTNIFVNISCWTFRNSDCVGQFLLKFYIVCLVFAYYKSSVIIFVEMTFKIKFLQTTILKQELKTSQNFPASNGV